MQSFGTLEMVTKIFSLGTMTINIHISLEYLVMVQSVGQRKYLLTVALEESAQQSEEESSSGDHRASILYLVTVLGQDPTWSFGKHMWSWKLSKYIF